MVAAGTIQTPEDVDGLEVSIRIDVSRITMHSGDMDLGSWPSGAVTITRIDDARFAFVAEGDRLLFSPADVDAFAAHPGVLDDTGPKQRRRKKAAPTPGVATRDPDPQAPPATADDPTRSGRRGPRMTSKPFTRKRSGRADPPPPEEGPVPGATPRPPRTGVWIRMIDIARPYSIFSLDRVPVDTRLRGRDHVHTWDHSAARSSGPSHHLCTICGKVRWR